MDICCFVSQNLDPSCNFHKDFQASNERKFIWLAKYNIINRNLLNFHPEFLI